jgi:imidazolonepropionase-like amidohydrolase
MRPWLILAVTVLALAGSAQSQPQQHPSPVRYDHAVIAITHVSLVDGTGAPAVRDRTIVIRDGRIAAIGPSDRLRVPSDSTIIDGTGKTVLPGFVFVHEHMFYPVGGGHFSPMLASFPPLYLAGGVTTARTGGTVAPYADINLREAIASGAVAGPDLDVTGPYIEGTGLPVMEMRRLADADETERFVDYWASAGATSFKAYMTLTRAELRRAIDTAHRHGARITGHLCAVSYREAAEMGIDNLEHGFGAMTDFVAGRQPDVCPLDQTNNLLGSVDPDSAEVRDLIRLLVERRVALTSTLVVFEDFTPGRPRIGEAALAMLNADARANWERVHRIIDARPAAAGAAALAKMLRLERMFVEAGGLLLAGTDPTGAGGALPGFASQRQIQLLVEAGLPFERAVQVGTLNGARFLRREREVGSIEVGKRADLILLDGGPTPAALDHIFTVFKAGRGYDREALLTMGRGLVGYR